MRRLTIFFFAFCCLMVGASNMVWAEPMQVQVKEGIVRSSASFLGSKVGTLAYGTRVDTKGIQGAWHQVVTAVGPGWMHQSALTTKEIVFSAGSDDVSSKASSDEIVLAGKGFNKQVEDEYRNSNTSANYPAVDKMEAVKTDPAEVVGFVRDGQLKGEEASQ